MHPSSFYDLRARYIYTPLYGPYSLSEALEGLSSYSLKEFQDSISIDSKVSLRHELILELSNVVDDLQDYLLYFSSEFRILPSNSPDPLKELRASCDGFERLSICWGAIISRLAIARGIVEQNFWPHLFRPAINNLAGLQRLGRRLPFASPNAPLNKSSAFASTFFPSSHAVSSPCSPYCLSDSQCLLFDVQSEYPQTMPSITNPTDCKEDHTSSWRLDTTPTPPFGSCPTRIPLNSQTSAIPLKSCFPQVSEDRSDEVFALPHDTIDAQRFCHSTMAYSSKKTAARDSNDNVKVAGIHEQATREVEDVMEGKGVTMVPSHSRPASLTSVRTEASGERITVSARTSFLSTASLPTSRVPCMTPTTPYMSNDTPHLCSESAIPLPNSFTSASSRPPTSLPPKKQHARSSALPKPFRSISITQKRSLKFQTQCFALPPVNFPATPPFQRQPLNFHSTYLPTDAFRPYQDER